MSKKGFDRALFWEGMRQLRLSGIVLLIISLFLNWVIPIVTWMGRENAKRAGAELTAFTVSANTLAPFSAVLLYAIPVILCLALLRPFHTRSGSDFYHSLANTRGSLYISLGAAALAWYYFITVVSVLSAALLYAALGASVLPAYVPYVLFTCLAGGTLVSAVALLSVALTGTIPGNLVLGALILFLPRLVTLLFASAVSTSLPIVDSGSLGVAGDLSFNIPAHFVLYVVASRFGGSSMSASSGTSDFFLSGGAIAYTYILAAVYLVLGWLAFRVRRSEMAGSNAPSRLLQHVYRCVIALPVALLIPYFATLGNNQTNQTSVYIVIGIVALFIYFLYELITTKKLKNLLKAVPVSLVLVGLCLVFGFGVRGVQQGVLAADIPASRIASVQIAPEEKTLMYAGDPQYNDLLTKDIRYTQEDIRAQVADDLDAAVQKLRYKLSPAVKSGIQSFNPSYTAVIRTTDGKVFTRHLGDITNMDPRSTDIPLQKLQAMMLKNAGYADQSTVLPKDAEITGINAGYWALSDKNMSRQLWDTYKVEYNSLTVSQKQSLHLRNYGLYQDNGSFASLYLTGAYDMQQFYASYTVSLLTPKTAQMMADLADSDASISQIKRTIDAVETKTDNRRSVSFQISRLVKDEDGATQSISLANYGDSVYSVTGDAAKALDLVKQNLGKPVDVTQPFASFNIYAVGEQSIGFSVYLPLTDDLSNQLQALHLDVSK